MDGTSHLLVLKVMRVSRPSLSASWQPFFSASPSFSAHATASVGLLQGAEPLPGHPKTLRDLTHASPLLTLPSSFGAVQLGETFSSCLCLNNEANEDVQGAYLKVEMQTATSKVILAEIGGADRVLEVGGVIETIVHHEIKEVGQHVLACTIQYKEPPSSVKSPRSPESSVADDGTVTFSKYYKFASSNPLSVKTKVHVPKAPSALLNRDEREKLFLEVHVQNQTQDCLWFEKMDFQPVDGYSVQDASAIAEAGQPSTSRPTTMSTIMLNTVLQPKDIRQYIYILHPISPSLFPVQPAAGSTVPLGRLDLSWRSSFGEPGRLLTSILSRRIPAVSAPPLNSIASALPLHMQRTQSPRPRSPQPQTPPLRPASPVPYTPRQAPAISRPQSPSLPPLPLEAWLPNLEIDLLVSRPKPESVQLDMEFELSLLLAVRAPKAESENPDHPYRFVVQHTKPPPPVSSIPNQAELNSVLNSPTTTTPLRSQAKSETESPGQNVKGLPSTSSQPLLLPPPYDPELQQPLQYAQIRRLGPSAFILPPVQMQKQCDANTNNEFYQAEVNFSLRFSASQTGYTTIGGLRVFMIRDLNAPDGSEGQEVVMLKKWQVISEIWVDP